MVRLIVYMSLLASRYLGMCINLSIWLKIIRAKSV